MVVDASLLRKVTSVIVTYNRKPLLLRCLDAVWSQQFTGGLRIVIVDNCSSDGTYERLVANGWASIDGVQIVQMSENSGGAGGFSKGLSIAIEGGSDWIWMMDDDAYPHPDALQKLLTMANDPRNIYGSLAVSGKHTSWATMLLNEDRVVHFAEDVPATARVESIPLLGFLIHRRLVEKIGYPDAGFFIAADDVEYCLRARRAGADIIIAGNSRIEHPRIAQQVIHVLGAKITYLSLAPWKRYYDTRNRLLVAREYYGLKLLTQTVPGSFVRLFAALRYEPRKRAQLWAWCCGMFDGLLGIKGKRHEKWGIRP